ncbi:hypothetical protein IMCC21906_00685 [Spongiibacter sp. IMCC21906]|jgi:hypothetical protein|uniref:hypothetical protein n=1 Tax=Spongiibacter sp. IMCC21906 TaxID=1620392 RepID=UPI00062DD3E8|nr:hypothetical protein [Spongiibacter sp. IMCC21906]AKH68378.1 hypothetical protein IMCC21906_00685 [Spongiibacter sp. IMCC21906]
MSHSQDFFDRPETIKWILRSLYLICGLLVALDFIIHRHTKHPWEGLYGFYPLYGFVGCVVLVLVARLMRRGLMRPEDYYQETSEEDGRANH